VVTNHTTEALYPRVARELLPKEHVRLYLFPSSGNLLTRFQWFPDAYYGEGQRGHRYHVFDEVRPPKINVAPSPCLQSLAFVLQNSMTQCSASFVQDHAAPELSHELSKLVRATRENPTTPACRTKMDAGI